MEKIKIKDKTFQLMMPETELLNQIDKVAERLNKDMKDKEPIFLGILNGSFMFAADLMKRITIPCEISFMKVSSYQGTKSTGNVADLIGLNEDLTGRNVVIVEDIVETGYTMEKVVNALKEKNAAEIHICPMFFKPEKLRIPLNIEYAVMEIPNDFIVGYGLDYDQQGRNLRNLYVLSEEQ